MGGWYVGIEKKGEILWGDLQQEWGIWEMGSLELTLLMGSSVVVEGGSEA